MALFVFLAGDILMSTHYSRRDYIQSSLLKIIIYCRVKWLFRVMFMLLLMLL